MIEQERKTEERPDRDVVVWERRTADRTEEEATVRAVPLEADAAGRAPVLRIVSSGFGAALRPEARIRAAGGRTNAGLRMAA